MAETLPDTDWDQLTPLQKLDIILPIDPQMARRYLPVTKPRGKAITEDYFESDNRLREAFDDEKSAVISDPDTGHLMAYDFEDGVWYSPDTDAS